MDTSRYPQLVKRRRRILGGGPDGLVYDIISRQIASQIAEGVPFVYPELAGWKRSKPRKHKSCSKSLRRRVRRAFVCCEYCGFGGSSDVTVDRIIPRLRGGAYEPSNVTGACLLCNSIKGAGEFIGPVRSLQMMEVARG